MTTNPRSPVERVLGIFADVRAGEGLTTLLLTLNVFLLLCAYYIIKPVREALILSEGSAEIKSYASAGQAVLLLGVVPLYAYLAGQLPRRALINTVTLFFVGCLALFYVLGRAGAPLGVVFYLWVGIFNVMVVAQFWSLANDLYTPAEGKRLFAIIAFGASSGAVFGTTVVKDVIEAVGVYPPFLISAGVLLLALGITNYIQLREKGRAVGVGGKAPTEEEPVGKGDAFALVLRTPYLLMIALMILFLNWVNTTGEYLLGRVVSRAAEASGQDVGVFIGSFYAEFFGVVNVVGMVIQLFLVSRILKFFGVRISLLVLPVIALLGYGILAVVPILTAVRWTKTAENSVDYSLMNTLRGVLFLPTTREQKYKAKQAIDTFFVRAGDVLSAGMVALGTNVFALSTTGFATINLVLVGIWLILAVQIGKQYLRLAEATGSPYPKGS